MKILTAERDIQPGEEITFCYTNWADPSGTMDAEESRMRLRSH